VKYFEANQSSDVRAAATIHWRHDIDLVAIFQSHLWKPSQTISTEIWSYESRKCT